MKPWLAIEIQHVPGLDPLRDATVGNIARELGRFPGVAVYAQLDDVGRGSWYTARRGWQHGYETGAEWVLVIQDDVVWCQGLVPWLEQWLPQLAHNEALSLYSGPKTSAKLAQQAAQRGWLITQENLGGPANVLHRSVIPEFLQWNAECLRPEFHHDDERLTYWLIWQKSHRLCPLPNLIDHACPTSQDSLLRHVGQQRAAHFLGEAASALDLPWAPPETAQLAGVHGWKSVDFDTRIFTPRGKARLLAEHLLTASEWDVYALKRWKDPDLRRHRAQLHGLQARLKALKEAPGG